MIHSEPEYIDITPELEERLRKFREERTGDELGGVGTTVLYEDDDLKIWELRLAPASGAISTTTSTTTSW